HGLGGYGMLPMMEMVANALRGPRRVLLLRDAGGGLSGVVALLSLAVCSIGTLAAIRRPKPSGAAALLLLGAVLLLSFNTTFFLASKVEQWHVLAVAASLMVIGALAAVDEVAGRRWALPPAVCLLTGFAILSHGVIFEYSPT